MEGVSLKRIPENTYSSVSRQCAAVSTNLGCTTDPPQSQLMSDLDLLGRWVPIRAMKGNSLPDAFVPPTMKGVDWQADLTSLYCLHSKKKKRIFKFHQSKGIVAVTPHASQKASSVRLASDSGDPAVWDSRQCRWTRRSTWLRLRSGAGCRISLDSRRASAPCTRPFHCRSTRPPRWLKQSATESGFPEAHTSQCSAITTENGARGGQDHQLQVIFEEL